MVPALPPPPRWQCPLLLPYASPARSTSPPVSTIAPSSTPKFHGCWLHWVLLWSMGFVWSIAITVALNFFAMPLAVIYSGRELGWTAHTLDSNLGDHSLLLVGDAIWCQHVLLESHYQLLDNYAKFLEITRSGNSGIQDPQFTQRFDSIGQYTSTIITKQNPNSRANI